MKKLLLLVSLLFVPIVPVHAQQTNIFETCTQYREHYIPGGYDIAGNYSPGIIQTEIFTVECRNPSNILRRSTYSKYVERNINYYHPRPYYSRQHSYYSGYYYCNPNNAYFGALLGGSVGRALTSTRNNRRNRGWATGLGAGIGGLAFSC